MLSSNHRSIFIRLLSFTALLGTIGFIAGLFTFSLSGREAFQAMIGLSGGLAIFLYGIELLSNTMRKIAGNQMRIVLSKFSKNIFLSILGGIILTVIFQSSSATTVLLVSFVEAQLLASLQTVGVIIGANIGKTITTQLIAFKLTNYSLLIITFGFILRTIASHRKVKLFGLATMGIGFLFLGMHVMSSSMVPMRDSQWFRQAILSVENPFYGILVGTLFTGVIQSSAAFTGIVIALAQGNMIGLEASIPLIFGANIGTCITALLASLNRSRDARRVAVIHIVFNLAGVLVFAFFIPQIATIVRWITPGGLSPEILIPRQIANAHTLFNLMAAILFIPTSSLLVKISELLIPKRKEEQQLILKTKYLDWGLFHTTSLAIERARLELINIGTIVEDMLERILTGLKKMNPALVKQVVKMDDKVDFLVEELNRYISDLMQMNLSTQEVEECNLLLSISSEMDHIADTIETNLSKLCLRRIEENLWFSNEGIKELELFHLLVLGEYRRSMKLIKEPSLDLIAEMEQSRKRIANTEQRLRDVHFERVQSGVKESIRTHQMHLDVLDQLRIINSYVGRIVDLENRYLRKFQTVY